LPKDRTPESFGSFEKTQSFPSLVSSASLGSLESLGSLWRYFPPWVKQVPELGVPTTKRPTAQARRRLAMKNRRAFMRKAFSKLMTPFCSF
jgi:hypothetical protein